MSVVVTFMFGSQNACNCSSALNTSRCHERQQGEEEEEEEGCCRGELQADSHSERISSLGRRSSCCCDGCRCVAAAALCRRLSRVVQEQAHDII